MKIFREKRRPTFTMRHYDRLDVIPEWLRIIQRNDIPDRRCTAMRHVVHEAAGVRFVAPGGLPFFAERF